MGSKEIALDMLRGACGIFLKDLKALPEDVFSKNFGGTSRTVADIVYEVNLVNDHIGLTIREEELFDWPEGGWITAPAGFDSKATVVGAFEASSKRILETVQGFSEEEILGTVVSDGNETTRFERCRFMALHLWYHSGQLNFMQTLLGDSEWHWMK